jgi:hypothetical protein
VLVVVGMSCGFGSGCDDDETNIIVGRGRGGGGRDGSDGDENRDDEFDDCPTCVLTRGVFYVIYCLFL